jgi:hypothetical protein
MLGPGWRIMSLVNKALWSLLAICCSFAAAQNDSRALGHAISTNIARALKISLYVIPRNGKPMDGFGYWE